MRSLKYTSLALAILLLAFCKTKKTNTAAATPAPATAPTAAAPAKTLAELQLDIAQARWPETKGEELTEGQTIYQTKCTTCHKNYDVSRFNEARWLHEIDDMSPKARLSPVEKQKLTKYILAAREAKEKQKAN